MTDYSQDYGLAPESGTGEALKQDYSQEYGLSPESENTPISTKPSDVTAGESYLNSKDYNGWCEKFQEQITGSPNMGRTAFEAWNNYAQQGRAFQGLQGAQPGDKIYFTGDKGKGHTGVISSIDPRTGDATFISATDNGVQELPVSSWLQSTGEQLLGFAR